MHLNFLALRFYKFMLLPAKQVAHFSSLLTVLLVNSTSFSWLQCDLLCIGLLNYCLATYSTFSPAAVCKEWAMCCHCVLTSGSAGASWRSSERRMENDSAIVCERNFCTSKLRWTDLQVLLYAQRCVRTLAATRKRSESTLADRSVCTSRMLYACRPSITTWSVWLLYPPQRGYISFVNTFVTPRNNDLKPYVPWRHLISAKF